MCAHAGHVKTQVLSCVAILNNAFRVHSVDAVSDRVDFLYKVVSMVQDPRLME